MHYPRTTRGGEDTNTRCFIFAPTTRSVRLSWAMKQFGRQTCGSRRPDAQKPSVRLQAATDQTQLFVRRGIGGQKYLSFVSQKKTNCSHKNYFYSYLKTSRRVFYSRFQATRARSSEIYVRRHMPISTGHVSAVAERNTTCQRVARRSPPTPHTFANYEIDPQTASRCTYVSE